MGELQAFSDREVLDHVFRQYDKYGKGELTPHEIQTLHGEIRMGGISYPQVLASMKYVCATDIVAPSELRDLLQEMDRRYFLLQDLRWEFSMLDRQQQDTITLEQARWLLQAVHGNTYSHRKWDKFLSKRAIPGSRVSFPEIEVPLCNVLSNKDAILDQEEEERERRERELRVEAEEEERLREQDRQRKAREEERRRKRREKEKQEEEARWRMIQEEELRKQELENKEREEREREKRRLRELEDRNREEERIRRQEEAEKYKNVEVDLEEAERREKEFEEELRKLQNEIKNETDENRRKGLVEKEKYLIQTFADMKHKRIRYRLKAAIKHKDTYRLEYTINEFRTEKVEDKDMELEKAERLLKELVSRESLLRAMSQREIQQIEKAIAVIKKHGLEIQLAKELLIATDILGRLRKIERIRSEILELKQSTVAEIRSYQNPPRVVHTVMTATFLVLGHKEMDTRQWKSVQALVGKTGRESLKRRCLDCDASKITAATANRAKELLEKLELDEVRDVSAGAATFYVFTLAMIEESAEIARSGSEGAGRAEGGPRPGIDPTSMVVSRSRKMPVTTVTTKTTTRTRSKTPQARKK